jgi:hypothetical protein
MYYHNWQGYLQYTTQQNDYSSVQFNTEVWFPYTCGVEIEVR